MKEYKDEPLQFVGVYVLKWRPEWGEPTAGFVDDDETDERIEELQANKRELRAELAALTSERDRLREALNIADEFYHEVERAVRVGGGLRRANEIWERMIQARAALDKDGEERNE